MNKRRRLFIALGSAVSIPRGVFAQAKNPPIVIGWLEGGSREINGHRLAAFKEGMAALGWQEGAQYVIEERWAQGKTRMGDALAVELAAKKPAVIVAAPSSMTRDAAKAAPGVPIVQANGASPVNSGLAKNHARPGGMVTGLSNLTGGGEDTLVEKYVEMLLLAAPKVRRIGFLADSGTTAQGWEQYIKSYRRVCTQYTIECRFLQLSREDEVELEGAFTNMREGKIEALVVQAASYLSYKRQQIVDRVLKERWPMIAGPEDFALSGALLTYGVNRTENYRRAAYYVDRILKGAKPGDLPIEQPHRIELTLNNKTAKALGLKLSPELLVRADRVIE
jgi:putative ABC transport system substrate-binding protein